MYLREVRGKNKTYLSLVEGYREGGKVKQRTLLSFGAIDELNEKSIVDFATKLLSYCKSNSLVDISNAQEQERRNWGAPALIRSLWDLFCFDPLLSSMLNKSKIKFNLGETLQLMLADKCCTPRSKLQTYQNKKYYEGFHTSEINLQNLYRALDILSKHKDKIESHIYEQNKRLYDLCVDVVFFDVTTFYFESHQEDELKNFGYSKDAKFNEVQVVLSLLINSEGRPVGFDLFEGNTYEGHTLSHAIIKLKEKYHINKAIIVADRGINSGLNLHQIKENHFEYIMGCRIKSISKSMKEEILNLDTYEDIATGDSKENLKYKVIHYKKPIIKDKKVISEIEEQLVCTWSSKRAKKDKRDRERLIEKAKEMLEAKTLENKRGAKKYITIEQQSAATLDEEKIAADEKWDGFYALETSDKHLSPKEILMAYHELWKIEESFRLLKSHFETRPIFHWTPKRIKGHFILSYISFLFERTIEIELKKRGLSPISPQAIRNALSMMEFSEIAIGGKFYHLYAPMDPLSQHIIQLLGIEPPRQIALAPSVT